MTPYGVTAFPFNQGAQTVTLNQFDAAAFPNYELTEVWLTLEGAAETAITVTAVGDVSVPGGPIGANIEAFNFSAGPATLSLNALPGGTFPAVNLLSGVVDGPNQFSGSDTDTAVLTGADLATFIGSGTFSADVSANGFFDAGQLTGGNIDTSQETTASGTLTIQYKGELVPEPTSITLMMIAGLGLLGFTRKTDASRNL